MSFRWLARPVRGWSYDAEGRLFTSAAPPRVAALPDRLRVVTWNVAYGYGPGSEAHDYVPRPRAHFQARLRRIAEALARLAPDVVLLQEVDFRSRRSHDEDQLTFLQGATGLPFAAAAVGWSVRYVPYPAWPPSRHLGPVASGGVVLSRFPVVFQTVRHHPQPAAQPAWYNAFYLRRYTQLVTLDLGGDRRLLVANSHLEDADAACRREQAAALASLAGDALARGDRLVLGGDLNGAPGDPDLAALEAVPSLAPALPPSAAATYPCPAPTVRLDHLFTGPGLVVESADVVQEPGDASDHLPVLAVLRLG